MNEKDIKVLKDKVKYLLEIKEGKQYLIVFDKLSGLTVKDVERFNKILEDEFHVKVVGLLLNNINSMRVLSLEG